MSATRAIPLALVPILAGCEFFAPTTVPSADSVAPWAVVSLWYEGDHQEIDGGKLTLAQAVAHDSFEHTTSDGWTTFVALAAAYDGGGAREAELAYKLTYRCLYGGGGVETIIPWTYTSQTQPGGVGSTVDNGVWSAFVFRPFDYHSQVGSCPADAYRMTLQWFSRAEDFHGNASHYGTSRVTFVYWGS